MQITFDPQNSEEVALIRHLFQGTRAAPPLPELDKSEPVAVEAKPRGRPRKEAAEAAQTTVTTTTFDPKTLTETKTETVLKPVEIASVTVTAPAIVDLPTAPAQPLFSIDEVRAKLVEYSGLVGNQDTAKALLEKVGGSTKLSQVPAAQYPAVMTAVSAAIAAVPKK